MGTVCDDLPPNSSILFVHYGDNWLRGSEYCLIDTVCALKKRSYKPVVWCNSKLLKATLEQHGVVTMRSPMNILFGYEGPKLDIKQWLKQISIGRRLIQQYQPNIVHLNGGAPAQWMNIACKLEKVPSVLQLHAHYGVMKDRVTLALHFCPHIIGVSYAAIRAFISDGVNPHRLHILPNAIDAQKLESQPTYALKEQLGLAPSDLLLLSVGSLIKRKDYGELLHSIALLKHSGNIIYSAIIGDGPERAPLEAQCRTLDIQNQVFFLGEKDHAFSYMKGDCDALVSTSKDEVFGLVTAEANLAKLPVIAPNIPGVNSVVIHRKTGLLYKSGSAASLANNILKLKPKSDDSKVLNRAYWRVKTTYSDQLHTQRLLENYRQAITEFYAVGSLQKDVSLGYRGRDKGAKHNVTKSNVTKSNSQLWLALSIAGKGLAKRCQRIIGQIIANQINHGFSKKSGRKSHG